MGVMDGLSDRLLATYYFDSMDSMMIPMTTNVVAAQADRFRGQNPSRKRAGPLVSFTPAPGDVASHSRVLRFPMPS